MLLATACGVGATIVAGGLAAPASAAPTAVHAASGLDANCPNGWPVEYELWPLDLATASQLDYFHLCSDIWQQEYVYYNGSDAVWTIHGTTFGSLFGNKVAHRIFREAISAAKVLEPGVGILMPGETVVVHDPASSLVVPEWELGVSWVTTDALIYYATKSLNKSAGKVFAKGSAARAAAWQCAWAAYGIAEKADEISADQLFSATNGIAAEGLGCADSWNKASKKNSTALPRLTSGIGTAAIASNAVDDADTGLTFLTRLLQAFKRVP